MGPGNERRAGAVFPPSRRKVRGHSGLTAWDLEVGGNITEREPV